MLTYWQPLTALVLALPLAVVAVVCSLQWFAAPFPGFFMMANAVIPTVGTVEWPAEKSALFHSQVIAVEGTPVRSSAEVYAYAAQRPAGTPVTYTFRKDDEIFRRTLPTRSFGVSDYLQTYGLLLFFGSICLASGIAVGFLQPRYVTAQVYLAQALVTGLYATTAVFLHRPDFPMLGQLCLVLESLFAATWVHLALVFPIERRFTGAKRLVPFLPYALSAGQAVAVLYGFNAVPPNLTAMHLTYVYNSVGIACFVAAVAIGYWDTSELLPRLRAKAILTGAIVCLPWPILAFLDNALSGRAIPVQLTLVLTPFGYASLGYAIVKHDLLDIDRVIRQSFIYTLLSIIVVGAYALLLALPVELIPGVTHEGRTLLSMVFVLVLAFALDPLRNLVQSLVDHAFYRRRLDYRATIRALSTVMTTLLDLRQVVEQVTQVVTDALQIESTAVCLVDGDKRGTIFARTSVGGARLEQHDEAAVVGLTRLMELFPQEPDARALLRRLSEAGVEPEARRLLTRLGALVVVPLMLHGRAIGLLSFGPKRSGQPFDSEAVDLLRTLADQTAIAIQNARSHQALEDLNRDLDAQVRSRTAELTRAYDELKAAQTQLVQAEKMASLGQLVAGVAHELNNPASFAYGGLENIQESLSALVDVLHAYERVALPDPRARAVIDEIRARVRLDQVLEDTPELLRVSAEGLERIKKIVDDLRLFARADSGERIATDIAADIDSGLRLLGDRLSRDGVLVTKQYDAVGTIEANAAQLNQAWMNLLTNALDAVHGRPHPHLEVCVREPQDGGIEVRIRDNGAGIAPAYLPRLFEPFFTTKPIGQGTGLGLSIAYGAVKAHGGNIAVDSTPEVGTTMTVWLPTDPSSQ